MPAVAQIGKRDSTLGKQALRTAVVVGALWVAWAGALWYALYPMKPVLTLALVLALPVFLAPVTYISLKSIRGHLGERCVFGALRRLPDEYWLFNDIVVPWKAEGSQIDHVVVSRAGVWCVETKSHKGMVFGKERERNWTQIKYSDSGRRYPSKMYNPIWQNDTHCRALAAHLDQELGLRAPVKSLVVFTSGKLEVESETPVVKLPEVADTIVAYDLTATVSEEDMAKIVALLGGPTVPPRSP